MHVYNTIKYTILEHTRTLFAREIKGEKEGETEKAYNKLYSTIIPYHLAILF